MATVEEHKSLLAEAEADLAEINERRDELEIVIGFHSRKIGLLQALTPTLPGIDESPTVGSLTGKKLPDAMRAVLARANRPMHVNQIAHVLVRRGFKKTNTLRVSISTTAGRRPDLFEKTDRATFKLRNGIE